MENKNLSQKDKYEAFRNYMFNELGVTKEEIRQWIREAVNEQVTNLMKQSDMTFLTPKELLNEKIIKYAKDALFIYGTTLKPEIIKEIATELIKDFFVEIKSKK